MTVGELIEKLKTFPPESLVVVEAEDENEYKPARFLDKITLLPVKVGTRVFDDLFWCVDPSDTQGQKAVTIG